MPRHLACSRSPRSHPGRPPNCVVPRFEKRDVASTPEEHACNLLHRQAN
jgi:hypothetical protein